MLKLIVPPKVLPFIRDIKDPTIAWWFLNKKYKIQTIAASMELERAWDVGCCNCRTWRCVDHHNTFCRRILRNITNTGMCGFG